MSTSSIWTIYIYLQATNSWQKTSWSYHHGHMSNKQIKRKNTYREKTKHKKNILAQIKFCIQWMLYLIKWGSYYPYASTRTQLSVLYGQEPEPIANKCKFYPIELSVLFHFSVQFRYTFLLTRSKWWIFQRKIIMVFMQEKNRVVKMLM